MISHKHKFIFSHVPKVAGTSIEMALSPYDNSGFKCGLRSDCLEDAIAKHKDYLVFGFVRNPYDRLVSAWKMSKVIGKHDMPFRDYVTCTGKFLSHGYETLMKLYRNNKCWKKGYPLIMKNAGFLDPVHDKYHTVYQSNFTYGCKFIGRYESLDSDFKLVCNMLGLKVDKLGSGNKAADVSCYKNHYDKNLQYQVYEMYNKDFLMFGYEYKL